MTKIYLLIAFDLKKVLSCSPEQTSFYCSTRVKFHNFTLTDIVKMKISYICGMKEKLQMDFMTLQQQCSNTYLVRVKKGYTCHLFADKCGKQNNNRMGAIALHDAFLNLGFEEITLNFLGNVHSQKEIDNVYTVTEAAVNKRSLYTITQWETTIQFDFKKYCSSCNIHLSKKKIQN